MSSLETILTPQQTVNALDKYIIGQQDAKRAVANALRNRSRRMLIDQPLSNEITPKNILMIGPTGVGKTEIARRLAKLANAPFIKVEATKFTEVGYVGRDVESILRDLVEVAVKQLREEEIKKVAKKADNLAQERILDALLPLAQSIKKIETPSFTTQKNSSSTREFFRKKLLSGELDHKDIEIEMAHTNIGVEIMAPPGMEDMGNQLQNLFQNVAGQRTKHRKLKIKDAYRALKQEEASQLIDDDEIKTRSISHVEQNGIVFIDELDKITTRQNSQGADVSREGVQRDLLPLIEGSTVNTKYGMLKTDHVLFIASGAFHLSKPSDLIPELQGRLPVRVELQALKTKDFERILQEPDTSLTKQYQALMATEGIQLEFSDDGIHRIAKLAWEINERTENIGARRLHTVMEKLIEKLSFSASEWKNKTVIIDAAYVDDQLKVLCQNDDLSRFIL